MYEDWAATSVVLDQLDSSTVKDPFSWKQQYAVCVPGTAGRHLLFQAAYSGEGRGCYLCCAVSSHLFIASCQVKYALQDCLRGIVSPISMITPASGALDNHFGWLNQGFVPFFIKERPAQSSSTLADRHYSLGYKYQNYKKDYYSHLQTPVRLEINMR